MVRTEPERSLWVSALLVAVATVFMLQATRVFVGYLVFVVDQSERLTLGLTALAVFLAPGLVWLLVRLAGELRILLASTMLLGVARLILQFWHDPAARVVLGAIVIIAWGWVVIVALHRLRAGAALGIVLALGLDIAIRIGAGAIDLPWMPGPGAHLGTVILAAMLVVAALGLGSSTHVSTGPALPLVALGPALVLHHLVTGNLALAQIKTGLNLPTAWLALAAGVVLGLGLAAIVAASGRTGQVSFMLLAIPTSGLALWLFWTTSTFSALWLVIVAATTVNLVSRVLVARDTFVGQVRIGRTTIAVTAGMVLQVLLLFVYYTFTGWVAMVAVAWGLLAIFAMLALPVRRPGVNDGVRFTAGPVGAVSLSLLLVCSWQFISWSEPNVESATNSEITVMTYNIQSGFSVDNVWNLEETARAIEAEDPDVIVLNEVGRGWLVTSGNDQLPWLSQRLDMPYVWGPASDDGLWGNAILSRLPMSESSVRKFASTQNLKRSAVSGWITVGESGFWIFGTHLDNPSGAGEARMEQVTELVAFWDNRQPALILGDLNADPEDDVLTTLASHGFLDPGVRLGQGAYTSEDRRRIDYILTTEGIEVLDIWIPETWASDHKPVVATVRIGE